ncbi:hypothetical protein KsCSTR_15930 [Candidatus Kuenenia stuttgartiensis]|uniref:Uncharacterized protein n=1 Tax=Kuenenia stuttgartiensis TaxID=174633 RepID=Q1Q1R4_KUEST|nr:hypothetical protein KsCSTR_15930 [Candidatus Kuenenia stuttgartiensis]CAJ73951.1 unknown protein [Candidatus Kuenenia stuttgartiensis]
MKPTVVLTPGSVVLPQSHKRLQKIGNAPFAPLCCVNTLFTRSSLQTHAMRLYKNIEIPVHNIQRLNTALTPYL